MALIANSNYKPPFWLINGHFETICPVLFRKVSVGIKPEKIEISTPDNDFFDLNYYNTNSDKTVVVCHGLEGNNQRPYILGMVKLFTKNKWNVVAWNYRGCNGKINNSIRSYHSGFTEDLAETIRFAESQKINKISLIGFSLGGNLTLKYLSEIDPKSSKIDSAVVFSVPLDLHGGCLEISKPKNIIYSRRFLRTLKKKVREKSVLFSEINTEKLSEIHDLMTFDDHYTAPIHGFKDAMDYYRSCSALYVLREIKTPTLIVNGLNDPFLSKECYPYDQIRDLEFVHLETPKKGGHVGFCALNGDGYYWSEKRALKFLDAHK